MATPDLATFRVRFPEFEKTSQARIEDALSGAAIECNPDQYGAELYFEAVLYLAADRIGSSPYGQATRSKDPGKKTIYQQHYERIQQLAGGGYRVL